MGEQKLQAMIVEDEPIISADLTYLMEDLGYKPLPPVRNYRDALLLLDSVTPDFILLDVSLEGEQDGISLAKAIKERFDLPLIFLTAHHDRQTIDKIKAVQPSAYLVKPINEYNLQMSIELALYNHTHRSFSSKITEPRENDYVNGAHFFIKVKNQLKKILLEDIGVLEAYDNYSYVHTAESKHLISSTLKQLEQKLPQESFIRVHRSYMVNLKAIERIEEDVITIKEMHIPIGKTYREEFMKRIELL